MFLNKGILSHINAVCSFDCQKNHSFTVISFFSPIIDFSRLSDWVFVAFFRLFRQKLVFSKSDFKHVIIDAGRDTLIFYWNQSWFFSKEKLRRKLWISGSENQNIDSILEKLFFVKAKSQLGREKQNSIFWSLRTLNKQKPILLCQCCQLDFSDFLANKFGTKRVDQIVDLCWSSMSTGGNLHPLKEISERPNLQNFCTQKVEFHINVKLRLKMT